MTSRVEKDDLLTALVFAESGLSRMIAVLAVTMFLDSEFVGDSFSLRHPTGEMRTSS